MKSVVVLLCCVSSFLALLVVPDTDSITKKLKENDLDDDLPVDDTYASIESKFTNELKGGVASPRDLEQIKVEVSAPKKETTAQNAVNNLEKVVQKFGLDRKLEKKKVNKFFRKLENKLYTDFKTEIMDDKEYKSKYKTLLGDYTKLAKEYDIN